MDPDSTYSAEENGYHSSDNEQIYDTGHNLRTHWTTEEDDRLRELVAKHGPMKWAHIAKQLDSSPPRNGKSCRLRWYNQLCPDIRKGPFTAEERAKVIKRQAEVGNRWAEIAQDLPGRTDNAVKNFWNGHVRRLQERARAAQAKRAASSGHSPCGQGRSCDAAADDTPPRPKKIRISARQGARSDEHDGSADSSTSEHARRFLSFPQKTAQGLANCNRALAGHRGHNGAPAPSQDPPGQVGSADELCQIAKHIVESTVARVREDQKFQRILDGLSQTQREQLSAAVRVLCVRAHAQLALGPSPSPGSQQLLSALRGSVSRLAGGAAAAAPAEPLCGLQASCDAVLHDSFLQDIIGCGGSAPDAHLGDGGNGQTPAGHEFPALQELLAGNNPAAASHGGGGAGGHGTSQQQLTAAQGMLFNLAMAQSNGQYGMSGAKRAGAHMTDAGGYSGFGGDTRLANSFPSTDSTAFEMLAMHGLGGGSGGMPFQSPSMPIRF